jgi:hypothetical protein
MTDSAQPTVTIVGAGMAGLTAALYLAERGYQVTIYEKGTEHDAGGNLGAAFHTFDEKPVCFEVFPHMFGDWYLNFFDLAEKLGLHKHSDFRRCPKIGYVIRDPDFNFAAIVDNGSPQTFLQNVRSGAGAPQDLFLAGYATVDMLAQNFMADGLHSEQTLNGFLASRPYATRGMLQTFEGGTLYIWAINSYITSVHAYQNFAKYQTGRPAPSSWALNDNSYDDIVKPLLSLLQTPGPARTPVDVKFNANVCGITAKDGKVLEICVDFQHHADPTVLRHRHKVAVDNLILAVPPSALGPLVTISADEAMSPANFISGGNAVVQYLPNLTDTRLLDSGPLAVLYVGLNQAFDFIHPYYVGLVDSAAILTFIEVRHLRDALGPNVKMVLAIGISNVSAIPAWQGNGPVDGPAQPPPLDAIVERVDLNWTIASQVLHEFIPYVPKEHQDAFRNSIIKDRIYLKANNTAKIFLNLVGSRQNAPATLCPQLPNLCFATGANDNPIEIATVECAVVGGLLAAKALWQQNPTSQGNTIHPINPRMPPRYDWMTLLALRAALSPWALAAKCLADGQEISQAIGRGPMRSLLAFPLEVAEGLWFVSLIPGTTAWRYWTEIFPPQPQSLQKPDTTPQIIGDISDLANSALEAATIPAWLGIRSARLGADAAVATMAAMSEALSSSVDSLRRFLLRVQHRPSVDPRG